MADPDIVHRPVLLEEIERRLDFAADAVLVDATIGQAGHALPLAARLDCQAVLIGLDLDACGIAVARRRLDGLSCRVELRQENFANLETVLDELEIPQVDVLLADLGFCSAQMQRAERGLSFSQDGPLDMRMDRRESRTAADIINSLSEKQLADLIWEYGQDRHSRRIARAIVAARREGPIETTGELVRIILGALGIRRPGWRGRIHPATRTFQALRIAVNRELANLERLLEMAPALLRTGGQIAVISFHSLEDRRVKHDFRENARKGLYEEITKKPIMANEQQRRENPRSRSAKLRLARRTARPLDQTPDQTLPGTGPGEWA